MRCQVPNTNFRNHMHYTCQSMYSKKNQCQLTPLHLCSGSRERATMLAYRGSCEACASAQQAAPAGTWHESYLFRQQAAQMICNHLPMRWQQAAHLTGHYALSNGRELVANCSALVNSESSQVVAGSFQQSAVCLPTLMWCQVTAVLPAGNKIQCTCQPIIG